MIHHDNKFYRKYDISNVILIDITNLQLFMEKCIARSFHVPVFLTPVPFNLSNEVLGNNVEADFGIITNTSICISYKVLLSQ
jgi:hypothetical protein